MSTLGKHPRCHKGLQSAQIIAVLSPAVRANHPRRDKISAEGQLLSALLALKSAQVQEQVGGSLGEMPAALQAAQLDQSSTRRQTSWLAMRSIAAASSFLRVMVICANLFDDLSIRSFENSRIPRPPTLM